jgi:AcrR family transcriptional regulator
MNNPSTKQLQLAENIVTATAKLITEQGFAAATVRAISEKVGLSAPQIYRRFGDIHGVYAHVALTLLNEYIAEQKEPDDAVKALHHMIVVLIQFGLKNYELYLHLSRPGHRRKPNFWKAQSDILEAKVKNVATAGRLRVDESHALAVILPLCAGLIQSIIQRTSEYSHTHWLVWQTVEPLIRNDLLKERFAGEPGALAGALAANLDRVKALTPGEEALMRELLARLASA